MTRLIVEFLGPSGVGKTTMLRNILAGVGTAEWQSLNEYIEGRHWRITPSEFSETESLLLEMRLANLLSAGMRPDDFLHVLFDEYRHVVFEARNRKQSSDSLYVACEHIFQLFIHEVNYLILHKPGNVRKLLEKRAFVFMTRPSVRIVDNVKRRRDQGEYRSFAKGATDAQLLNSINWFVSRAPSLKRFIKSNGNPMIEVNLDDSEAEAKVTDFLNDLAKQ